MKTFISMGMQGKSTDEVKETMKSTFEQILEEYPEAVLIDSVIAEEPPKDDNIGMWYLAKSIELMAVADKIFFINDYDSYRGCSLEKTVAEAYGKECVVFKTK